MLIFPGCGSLQLVMCCLHADPAKLLSQWRRLQLRGNWRDESKYIAAAFLSIAWVRCSSRHYDVSNSTS